MHLRSLLLCTWEPHPAISSRNNNSRLQELKGLFCSKHSVQHLEETERRDLLQAQARKGLCTPKGLHPLCGISGGVCMLRAGGGCFWTPGDPEPAGGHPARNWLSWAGRQVCDSSQTQRLSSTSLLTHTPSSASSGIFFLSPSRPRSFSNPEASPAGRRGLRREVESPRANVGKGASRPLRRPSHSVGEPAPGSPGDPRSPQK